MATPAVGSVVVVRFPFSDLSSSKVRPAIVLADVDRGDFVLCQVTSKPYGDSTAIELRVEHFESGSLRQVSYVRPGKLFTANTSIIRREVGTLTSTVMEVVVDRIYSILRAGIL